MNNFEGFALWAIGMLTTNTEPHTDHLADNLGKQIVDAVENSETEIDDALALKFARWCERVAASVQRGLTKLNPDADPNGNV